MRDIAIGSKSQLVAADIYRNAEHEILLLLVASMKGNAPPQVNLNMQRKIQKIIDEAERGVLDTASIQIAESYLKGYERDKKHNKVKAAAIMAAIALYTSGKDKATGIRQIESWMNFHAVQAVSATEASLRNAARTFRFSARQAQIDLMNDVVRSYSQGGMTWLEAKQIGIKKIAASGITHFRDKAGRRWQIDTYAEMCVRTGIANASRAGFDQSMEERGIDLVYVSAHPGACPLCVPWEGEILSRTGNGGYPSVEEAGGAGLFHPNCGHVLYEYIEGYSKLRKFHSPENSELYKNRQKQRAMERDIRRLKREYNVAADEKAKKEAKDKVSASQARIRRFTRDKGLPRKYYREQIP